MSSFYKLAGLIIISVNLFACVAKPLSPTPLAQAEQLRAQGLTRFERGQFEQAIPQWQQAAQLYEPADKIKYLQTLINLAEAYQRVGHYQPALELLENKALTTAEAVDDNKMLAAVHNSLGPVYFFLGQVDKAQSELEQSIQLAQQTNQPALQALGLLHLALVLAAQPDYPTAQYFLKQSIQLAQQHHLSELAMKGFMNMAWISIKTGDKAFAQTQLTSLWQQLLQQPNNHEKAYLLFKLHEFAQQLGWPSAQLQTILETALTTAKTIDDNYMLSQAFGELGHLYEQQQQIPLALQYTQQARLSAQSIYAPQLLYRWHWQAGRLLKTQGDIDNAIQAYQQTQAAINELRTIPQEPNSGCPTARPDFNTIIKPIFLELADLLLQRSRDQADKFAARQVIESLKTTELQDYFQDDCLTQLWGKPRQIDEIAPQTAVIYPIVFAQRLELLLSLPHHKIQQATVNQVTAAQLKQTVQTLRTQLEADSSSDNYLKPAQQLYTWLIQPLQATLTTNQIKTLIVVPELTLGTIPFAVLHDGKQFLIEQYALAITPGITLTAPTPNTLTPNSSVLAGGLTEVTPKIAQLGYQPLRLANAELEKMLTFYPHQPHHQLKGADFTIKQLEQSLTNKSITLLHLFSHAQFAPDLKNTFIVTYDDKLTINHLEKLIKISQYKEKALELITLSACETVKGDERAALGLSGVALKSGARSALATLWKAWDESAFHVTSEFYQHLQQFPSASKAQALQAAQQSLLNSQYKHPHYWSPFILIGNWL
jgi:CHAT domain-containing protein